MKQEEIDAKQLRALVETAVGPGGLANYLTCASAYREAADELARLNEAAEQSGHRADADDYRSYQYADAAVDALEAAQRVLAALGWDRTSVD